MVMNKKAKKYEQSAAMLYPEPTQGSKIAKALEIVVARLFGASPAAGPTRQEIIDYHLTPREREIAYLAALGFSDKEIADALMLNFQTVRVHLHNILSKLRLDDVAELRKHFSAPAPGAGAPRDRY
jgi:DNA-binding NarL/FixJ family response regulator